MSFGGGGFGGMGGGMGRLRRKPNPTAKPRFLLCYVCGREYGTRSLKIHIPQCIKMWKKREMKKEKWERRPVPKPGPGFNKDGTPIKDFKPSDPDAIDAFNAQAQQTYNTMGMVSCPICERTFREEAYRIHARSCRPGLFKKSVKTPSPNKGKRPAAASSRVTKSAPRPRRRAAAAAKKRAPATGVKARRQAITSTAGNSGAKVFCVGCGAKLGPEHRFCFGCGAKRVDPEPASDGGDSDDGEADTNSNNDNDSGSRDDSEHEGEAGQEAAAEKELADKGKALFIAAMAASGVETETAGDAASADAAADNGLEPCGKCGRNFNPDRVAKHEAVCKGPSKPKKKRVVVSTPVKGGKSSGGSSSSSSAKKTAWREKSKSFQESIRYARKVTAMQKAGKDLSTLPPPPRSVNPDYITCEHCSRSFAPKAAERHIPRCAGTVHKARPPPSSVSSSRRAVRTPSKRASGAAGAGRAVSTRSARKPAGAAAAARRAAPRSAPRSRPAGGGPAGARAQARRQALNQSRGPARLRYTSRRPVMDIDARAAMLAAQGQRAGGRGGGGGGGFDPHSNQTSAGNPLLGGGW